MKPRPIERREGRDPLLTAGVSTVAILDGRETPSQWRQTDRPEGLSLISCSASRAAISFSSASVLQLRAPPDAKEIEDHIQTAVDIFLNGICARTPRVRLGGTILLTRSMDITYCAILQTWNERKRWESSRRQKTEDRKITDALRRVLTGW